MYINLMKGGEYKIKKNVYKYNILGSILYMSRFKG